MGEDARYWRAGRYGAPILESVGTTRPPLRHITAQAHLGSRRGRPRKLCRPSQFVTLTLPDDVITARRGIDADLSRTIVRVTQPLVPRVSSAPAELFSYGDRSVIIVRPSQVLRDRNGGLPVLRPRSDHDGTRSAHFHSLSYRSPDAIADSAARRRKPASCSTR